MSNPNGWLEAAQTLQPEVVALRRAIHAEPELGLQLPATRARVLEAIDDLDLELTLHERTSGIAARLRSGNPGKTILLRGDMDALPMPEDTELPFKSTVEGRMHACGHDAHTAMLAGAARLLHERRAQLQGDVVFMFQPGEEGFHGAREMIDEGVLDGVDAAFAIHVAPMLPCGRIGTRPGPLLASADFFEITIRGKGGHASMPHDCNDPVPVACEFVQAVQTFVSRRIPVADPVVVTVSAIHAGTTNNVIPEAATVTGTIRALSEGSREAVHAAIHRLADHITAAHEMQAEIDLQIGYPVTVNDAGFESFVREAATAVLGPRGVVPFPQPVMGAEDFSYLLHRVPGAMVFLGVRPDGVKDAAPCHSNKMLLQEEGMAYGTALYAAVAEQYLAR